jgi:methylglutaconyl-CoA hydratase
MANFIKTEINGGVAALTLNRPDIHNAFNDEMIAEIITAFEDFSKNESIRLVTITGEGRSFCAGADLNWMKSMANYTFEQNVADSEKLQKMFETINNFSKPVLGKINGHTLGGGVGLISVCDFVLCSKKAKLGFTEVKLGLIPAVISPYVINKIGESHARAWFLSGDLFNWRHAVHMGLVHEECEPEELDQRFDEIVSKYLQAGPKAAMLAKKLIFDLKTTNDIKKYTCEAIANARVSDEGQEGMSALLDKRKASWVKE